MTLDVARTKDSNNQHWFDLARIQMPRISLREASALTDSATTFSRIELEHLSGFKGY